MTSDDANPAAPPARLILIAILGAAALLRALYFFAYTDLPFIYGPVADSVIYLRQAAQIRSLTFGTPEQIAFSPLYGYFLALTFAHVSLVIPILLQFALGVATVYVVYRTALRTGGPGPAAAAAIVLTLYGTLMFFESKILSESLSLFLLSVTLHQFLSPRFAAARPSTAIGAGALLALSILSRASLLFTAPLHVVAALLPFSGQDRPWKPRLWRTLFFTAGFGAVLLANGLWNHHHSGLFVPVIYVADTAIDAEFSATTVVEQARDAINGTDRQTSSAPPGDILDTLKADIATRGLDRHSDSGVLLRLASAIFAEEKTFEYYHPGEQRVLTALRLAPLSFLFITLLALSGAGFLLRRHRGREILPLLPVIVGCLVAIGLYHFSARYRVAMALPLAILCGHGTMGILQINKKVVRIAAVASFGVLLAGQILLHRANPALWQISLARSAIEMKDFRSAIRCVNTAEAIAGDQPAVQHDLTRLRNSIADGIRRQQQLLQENSAPPEARPAGQ